MTSDVLHLMIAEMIANADKNRIGIIGDYLEDHSDPRLEFVRKSNSILDIAWLLQTEGQAFVTGSYAYGTPLSNSDIDLVVYLPDIDFELLLLGSLRDTTYPWPNLRFGRLNMICVDTLEKWRLWKQGTSILKSNRPVTRLEAIETFKKLGL